MTEREFTNFVEALVIFWPVWGWIIGGMITGAIVLAIWQVFMSLMRRVT